MVLAPIPLRCTAEVTAALDRIGRTEDVAFSPDGRRIAIAAFHADAVVLLDVAGPTDGGGAVALSGALTLRCADFHAPHGLAFSDDDLLVVSSRHGGVVGVPVPAPGSAGTVRVDAAFDLGAISRIRFDEPGSVTVTDIGLGWCEVLVCHNTGALVSRHLVDPARREIVDEELMLGCDLAVPDGLAMSLDGCWTAVSNHATHEVLMFRNDPALSPLVAPVGRLTGLDYPHGLCFAGDDEYLLVADAGAPVVHVFERGGGWDRTMSAVRVVTVKDDVSFARTRHNEREGGPKGLDVHHGLGLVALTSELQPLVVHTVQQMTGVEPARLGRHGGTDAGRHRGRAAVTRALARLARAHGAVDELLATRAELRAEIERLGADLDEQRRRADSAEHFLRLLVERPRRDDQGRAG